MPKVPRNTPGIDPVPPRTTMQKMMTDSRKRPSSGEITEMRLA